MPPGDPPADEIAHLDGLPPEEFVAARNAAAKACRQNGRRDDAAAIAALRKPSVIESAVNRTARRDPETRDDHVGGGDAGGRRRGSRRASAVPTRPTSARSVKEVRATTEALVAATVTTIGDETKYRDDIAALLRGLPVGAVDQVVSGVLGSADRTEADLFAGAPTPPPRPVPRRPEKQARTSRVAAPIARTRDRCAAASAAITEAVPARRRTLVATVERRRGGLAATLAARQRPGRRRTPRAAAWRPPSRSTPRPRPPWATCYTSCANRADVAPGVTRPAGGRAHGPTTAPVSVAVSSQSQIRFGGFVGAQLTLLRT